MTAPVGAPGGPPAVGAPDGVAAAPGRPWPRLVVGGVRFDAVDQRAAADYVVGRWRRAQGGRVVTPNVDILRQATVDRGLAALVAGADLVLADGMPIVWAARLAGRALPGRVPGSALGPLLARRAADGGVPLFLLGGAEGAAERAAAALRAAHPGLHVAWHFPPFGFESDPTAQAGIESALAAFGPCVCLVGLGFPKQDLLARRLLGRFPTSWFVGVGATIEFMAGDRRRAPVAVQRLGLEWAHRLALEPRRLAERYLRRDLPFALALLARSAVARVRPSDRPAARRWPSERRRRGPGGGGSSPS